MYKLEDVKPIDAQLLKDALDTFAKGFNGNEDIEATIPHFFLKNSDGSVDEMSFTNHPEVRGMFAVKKFLNDETLHHSVTFRLWGLRELFAKGTSTWWNDAKDFDDIPFAVFQVAAEMMLNKKGHFNQKRFDKAVATLGGTQ
jgi:hypothetical protein